VSRVLGSSSASLRRAPGQEAIARQAEAEFFNELAQSISASLDLETVLRRVAEGAESLCDGDLAEIALWDELAQAMVIRYWSRPPPPADGNLRIERGKGMGGLVMATGRPGRTDDYAHDPGFSKDYLATALAMGVVSQIVVPINGSGRLEGLLFLVRHARRAFTDAEEALLQRLANHAGIAIANARLYAEANRRGREAQELVRIARSLTESLDIETLGERIVESLRPLFGARSSALRLLQADGSLRGVAWGGPAREHFQVGHVLAPGLGVVGQAVARGRPVWSSDIRRDPAISTSADMERLNALAGNEAVLAVPLRVGETTLGILSISDRAPRVFTEAEVTLLQAFADQAAVALDHSQHLAARTRAEDEIRARARQQETIAQLGQRALSGVDVDTLMEEATRSVARTLDVDLCQLLQPAPDGRSLVLRHGIGWRPGYVGVTAVPADATSVAGLTLQSSDPVILEAPRGPDSFSGIPHLQAHGAVSGLSVAIRGPERVAGVLSVHATRPRTFTRDEAAFLQTIANLLASVVERHAFEAALRESEARFRAAFEQSGIGRALQSLEGRYLRVNAALSSILGYSEQELLELTWQDITHPDDLRISLEPEAPLFAGTCDSFIIEKRYRHKQGHIVWVSATISLVRDAAGRPLHFLSEFIDITPRKRADEALREHADRLQTLHEIDRGILCAASPEAIAGVAARRIRRLVPCARVDVLLFDFEAGQALLLAAAVARGSHTLAGTRSPLSEHDVASTTPRIRTVRTPRGRRQAVRTCLSVPLLFGERLIGRLELWAKSAGSFGTRRIEIAQEVANSLAIAIQGSRLFEEVRAGHARLRDLSRRLVHVQEVERRHIARELHDEIGQVLTGLNLTLDARSWRRSGARAAGLDQARRHVHELIMRVRELSLDLRPAMLDDLGLLSAILWHVERYTQLTGVRVHVEHSGIDRRFDPEVETGAYRIMQEALTNVARHAQVREARVRIWADAYVLRAEVTDRGVGFDEAVAAGTHSGGLTGMRERAELLGGRLLVESTPVGGTRVLVELPLR
jgi:PAS domain S-box-containing protein